MHMHARMVELLLSSFESPVSSPPALVEAGIVETKARRWMLRYLGQPAVTGVCAVCGNHQVGRVSRPSHSR